MKSRSTATDREEKMPKFMINRESEDIRRELTDIMRSLKDPRISGMLTIVRVDVSSDGSYCKVYVSSLDGLDAAKRAVKGLENAKGFIKREIGHRLSFRKMPEFRFIADNSTEYGASIMEKISALNIPEAPEAEDDTEE